jgi:signal transduction histidine kinase
MAWPRSLRAGLAALILGASGVAWFVSGAALWQAARAESAFTDWAWTTWLLLFIACTGGLVLASLWLLRGLLKTLAQATAQLDAHAPGEPRSLATAGAPDEVQRLLHAADGLCRRYEHALDAERRFTAAAAHELRTPLAAVRVQAQVAERARTPEDAREALAQLHVCVDRATRTIDQLLTLAQFEAVHVAPGTMTKVELASLAARVIHDMGPLLRARGITLTMSLEPAAVMGLEHGLAALLRNLLDNAARHSPPNSQVRVASGAANDEAFVTVDDSGPGIPLDERERVFERFYRLPTQNADGIGVGLSIVQTVARAHGGRIVLSESDLGGLRAAFFLSQEFARRFAAYQTDAATRSGSTDRTAASPGEVGNHPPTPRG